MNLASPARWSIKATLLGMLAACSSAPMTLPGPITYARTPQVAGGVLVESTPGSPTPSTTVVTKMPSAPMADGKAPEVVSKRAAPAAGDDEPVSIALEQTPLPLFIQILYGNVLKRPYSMDTAINARTDLVTFKTSTPISRARLAELGVTLLRSYGLAVQDFDGLIRIVPDNSPSAAPPPVLRRGRAMPETPEALRPAFQHVELDIVRSTDISQWLRQILGNRVNVQEDSVRNGFLLAGTQADLRTALDLIRILDQPRMRGNVARRITPVNMPAAEFATRLVDVLTAQGYSVSSGASGNTAILMVPIPTIGAVMVFANSEAVMDHVLRWAAELDKPVAVKAQNGLYTYPVKYADAQELAKILSEILSGVSSSSTQSQVQGGIQPAGAAAAAVSAAAAPRPSGNRVVVNTATNTLIFRGTSADEYQQIMSLMRELDRPVKSAMVEVVVAELARNGTQTLGIDWNIPTQSVDGGKYQVSGGTLGNIGFTTGGFSSVVTNAGGAILARLAASVISGNSRILSNPKVLARNGETATIQVGQEVPVVTSQQSTGTTGGLFGTTGVLQQITYRSTGVILRVRPVINSGNRLDLDISQEVSSAAQTATGVSASPTIQTRRIETKLSLRDGSTVLLGGLIARQKSTADNGVPILKDIPGLGAAFRSRADSDVETELLVMITPYVINDDYEAETITEAIQQSFGDWAQDIKRARVVPIPIPGAAAPSGPTPAVPAPSPVAARPESSDVPSTPPVTTAPGAMPAQGPARAPDGVTMSKPDPATSPASTTPGAKPVTSTASEAKPPAAAVAPPVTKEVTDPKIKEEILKLIEKRQ